MNENDKGKRLIGSARVTGEHLQVGTILPPETLPAEVIKKLEESGVLAPSPRRAVATPQVSQPLSSKTPPPPPPQSAASPFQSPPPPPSKTAEFKVKVQPLIPNLQKLIKLISGTSLLPGGVSFDQVRLGGEGSVYLGKMEIGRIFEGKDGDGVSVRIFLSKLNIQDSIPEAIKSRFPISESLLAVSRTKCKFFVVTEKSVALVMAKSEEDTPFLSVFGSL